jgi:hypothetical protein
MENPQKFTESFPKTLIRTLITAALIAVILLFAHVFPLHGMSKPAVFSIIWLMIFCIVFGGHWLELLFINDIKFMLPQNLLLFYLTRLIYWFLCAIPLFILADWIGNSLSHQGLRLGNWLTFGFFYIGIELFMHAIMHLRWKKSFYNGIY